jgi:coatomer subunit beta'
LRACPVWLSALVCLIFSSWLLTAAETQGKNNIAFMAYLQTGNIEKCIDILIATRRFPEAALLARTYSPSLIGMVVLAWKAENPGVVSPQDDPSAFPDFEYALVAEEAWKRRVGTAEAREYLSWKESAGWDIIEGMYLCLFV